MKKTLVALAALAATSAFAQSSVTIYGIADVAYASKTHTAANGTVLSKTAGIGEGFNAGNRIGFRGTEDLGGGMKANFVIENGINITNGNLFSTRAAASGQQLDGNFAASGNMPAGAYSTGTNRQAYVGAAGGFGEVRLGFQYTALYTVSTLSGYHVGSEQPGGDLAHGTLDNANYGGTRANGITYILPKFGDVTATLQMGAGSGRETAELSAASDTTGKTVDNLKRTSLLLNYASGPLNASFAHTKAKFNNSAVTAKALGVAANQFGLAGVAVDAAVERDYDATLNQLGASYQLGALKLVGTWADGERIGTTDATKTTSSKAQQVGAEYAYGKARPFLTTGTAKTYNNTGAVAFDAKLTQYGVRYDLSKRTTAYFISGSTKDSIATAATIAERKATAFGLFHSF
jgi:predicted porin